MKIRFCTLAILIFSFASIALASESVHDVRREVREGKIDVNTTCVDEYIHEANKQIWKTGLTPPIGVAGTGVLGFGATIGTGYVAQALGIVSWDALAVMGMGGFVGLCVGTATLATLETMAITKLVQTNFLIKVIAEAKGDPKNARKSFTKFLNKYDHKYPQDHVFGKIQQATELLNTADSELKLCDGSLVKSKHRKLATKKEIFAYLHSGLNNNL